MIRIDMQRRSAAGVAACNKSLGLHYLRATVNTHLETGRLRKIPATRYSNSKFCCISQTVFCKLQVGLIFYIVAWCAWRRYTLFYIILYNSLFIHHKGRQTEMDRQTDRQTNIHIKDSKISKRFVLPNTESITYKRWCTTNCTNGKVTNQPWRWTAITRSASTAVVTLLNTVKK